MVTIFLSIFFINQTSVKCWTGFKAFRQCEGATAVHTVLQTAEHAEPESD